MLTKSIIFNGFGSERVRSSEQSRLHTLWSDFINRAINVKDRQSQIDLLQQPTNCTCRCHASVFFVD